MTPSLNDPSLPDLLENPRRAGLYHLPDRGQAEVKTAAATLGFACFEVDFADATTLDVVLDKLGQMLDFPGWYGRNLDALKDCLTDLSWCEAAGYVLIITRAEPFYTENFGGFRRLNQVFELAVDEWREMACPFWVFYDLRPDGSARLPTLT